MLKVVSLKIFKSSKFNSFLLNKILVYPTDTVYGIGCNALKPDLVKEVYKIKRRDFSSPVSVIAPSKEWILNNFKVSEKIINKYLPGPYTLILRKKDERFLRHINKDSLGVRIPSHVFSDLVSQVGVPFVTTSANFTGSKAASKVSDLKEDFVKQVDLVIDGGSISGRSSTLVDLRNGLKITERD